MGEVLLGEEAGRRIPTVRENLVRTERQDHTAAEVGFAVIGSYPKILDN